ncbi:hypothetical protein [Sphingomonas sp. CFBP9019]|uniref:hypothetical protein n=1 Tax=Sphingomonas sp. CFBP9019 TaxID=3096532 RepID=UPI002A6B1E52|nr:hypothetical protein [Sphingomonas sp. CFBP9019]MDY1010336.1 hypothetical protein [Sphingomonas sp. CFBP9019]
MWIDGRPLLTKWHGGQVEPSIVLYDFDGPAIFTCNIGPATFLFFKVEEQDDGEVYLLAPIDDDELASLRGGRLSIRGAMSHREAWLALVDFDFNVVHYQEQSHEEYLHLLPENGIALYERFGEVADTLEQAEAFMSFKFESSVMSSVSMPLSVLKARVDAVSDVVRSALLPSRLSSGRKSRYFDPEVAPLRFNSLLIAIKEPQFDKTGLLSSKETQAFTPESLTLESEQKSAHFLSELEKTTKLARDERLTRQQANDHFEVLEQITSIVPTSKNELTRLQIGFRTSKGTKLVSIDKRTGDRLVEARLSIQAPVRTIIGSIIELNDDAKTFIVKDVAGRQTTVNPLSARYREMEARKLLKIGQSLKLKGKLWERSRRDYIILTVDVDPLY